MPTVDVLIFDMDGVLIDVSGTYREAIRRVPQVFFEGVCRLEPMEGELVSPEAVEAFKQAGGFNNDCECTAAVTAAFAAHVPEPIPKPPKKGGVAPYVAALGKWGPRQGISVEDLARRADLGGVAGAVSEAGGGIEAALAACGFGEEGFPVARGSLIETNVLTRLFQEMLLGPELFEATYGEAPLVLSEPGLIDREELLIDRAVLEGLASKVPLGIATGRPRAEVAHALRRHEIDELFAAVVDDEDISEAEAAERAQGGEPVRLRKPHPWSLIEAVRRITDRPVRAAYVGDTPDDIRAAKAAAATVPFIAIGTAQRPADFKHAAVAFREVGADIILGHPNGLQYLDLFGEADPTEEGLG
ncbi:MAG: HAD family hydrolase [Nitrospinota bacterium]